MSLETAGGSVFVVVVADDDGFPELLHDARQTPATSTEATARVLARLVIRPIPLLTSKSTRGWSAGGTVNNTLGRTATYDITVFFTSTGTPIWPQRTPQ